MHRFELREGVRISWEPDTSRRLADRRVVIWVSTLVLTVTNYTSSDRMCSAVLTALSVSKYSRARQGHWAQKWVEPINITAIILMVAGFFAFGRFAVLNLERITRPAKGQETSIQKSEGTSKLALPPAAAAGVSNPATQKYKAKKR